jgi:hypothetical protein
MIRILIPVAIFIGAIILALYTGIVKKNWKQSKEIMYPTMFFGAVWAVIYYLIFS